MMEVDLETEVVVGLVYALLFKYYHQLTSGLRNEVNIFFLQTRWT